jgi:hypothetical protein
MLGFVKKSASKAHIVTAAMKMLSFGNHYWFCSVGEKNARKLLDSLATDFREELHSHRQLLKDTYPPSLLNISGIIELARLMLGEHSKEKVISGLAGELLLVSIEALRGADEVGVGGISSVLSERIGVILYENGLDLTDLMFPS